MLALAIIPEGIVNKFVFKQWQQIDEIYNVNFIYRNSSIPHITLISGLEEKCKVELLIILKNILKDYISFNIYTKGLGMLILEKPLIYLRWSESLELNVLRGKILNKIIKKKLISSNIVANKDWIMKTTICYGDLEYNEKLLKIINSIKKNYLYDMKNVVNNIAMISYSDNSKEIFLEKVNFRK